MVGTELLLRKPAGVVCRFAWRRCQGGGLARGFINTLLKLVLVALLVANQPLSNTAPPIGGLWQVKRHDQWNNQSTINRAPPCSTSLYLTHDSFFALYFSSQITWGALWILAFLKTSFGLACSFN
jgi:hypothetical protein